MEKIRVVELFAGVGGFRLGLEQASANFQTVWANQWEPSMQAQFAFDCYERHFGHRPEHVCQDIVTAKGNIPHMTFWRGFPCQDYSIAKKGARGIEGKKGVLGGRSTAILRAHKPRYVLLENVTGSSNLRHGKKGVIFPSSCGASMKQAMPLNGG